MWGTCCESPLRWSVIAMGKCADSPRRRILTTQVSLLITTQAILHHAGEVLWSPRRRSFTTQVKCSDSPRRRILTTQVRCPITTQVILHHAGEESWFTTQANPHHAGELSDHHAGDPSPRRWRVLIHHAGESSPRRWVVRSPRRWSFTTQVKCSDSPRRRIRHMQWCIYASKLYIYIYLSKYIYQPICHNPPAEFQDRASGTSSRRRNRRLNPDETAAERKLKKKKKKKHAAIAMRWKFFFFPSKHCMDPRGSNDYMTSLLPVASLNPARDSAIRSPPAAATAGWVGTQHVLWNLRQTQLSSCLFICNCILGRSFQWARILCLRQSNFVCWRFLFDGRRRLWNQRRRWSLQRRLGRCRSLQRRLGSRRARHALCLLFFFWRQARLQNRNCLCRRWCRW